MTSVSWMHEAGHSKLVLSDNLEGRGEKEGGRGERGFRMGTHVHPWQIHVDVWQNQCSVVGWLASN